MFRLSSIRRPSGFGHLFAVAATTSATSDDHDDKPADSDDDNSDATGDGYRESEAEREEEEEWQHEEELGHSDDASEHDFDAEMFAASPVDVAPEVPSLPDGMDHVDLPPADMPPDSGGAASSSSVPPPPVVARRRGKPEATMTHPGGVVSYYAAAQKGFQATCKNKFHGNCILTRRRTRAANMRGRPLGLHTAFLDLAFHTETKEEHLDWVEFLVDNKDARKTARGTVAGFTGGADVLQWELPKGDDSDTELDA